MNWSLDASAALQVCAMICFHAHPFTSVYKDSRIYIITTYIIYIYIYIRINVNIYANNYYIHVRSFTLADLYRDSGPVTLILLLVSCGRLYRAVDREVNGSTINYSARQYGTS